MVVFPALGGTAIGGFGIVRFMSGEYAIAIFDFVVSGSFFALGVYTFVTGRDTAARYISAAISVIGPLYFLQQLSPTGMYWVYSSTVVLYYLIPLRWAIGSNIAMLSGVFAIYSNQEIESVQLASLLITIGLTNMFSLFFSQLTEQAILDRIELKAAQREVEALRELLPICANCHRIRDEEGNWHQLESYLTETRGTRFSHGVCPTCLPQLYPDGSPSRSS